MIRLLTITALGLCLLSCKKESQVDKATREGILLLGNSSDPMSFDPHLVTGVTESNINRALFEGLIRFDSSDDLATPGGVALEMTPDETSTIWTVKLRPGLKWSDGQPLTSEDFAFSYERMLTPALAADYAEMLYFLNGAEAFNKKKTTDFSTVGITVIDPLTFTLTLRGPTPFFREIVKHFIWYPLPKHAILKYGGIALRGNAWAKPMNLVSNGPFRIKSFRRNDHIEVERNPYYWDAANVSLNGIRFLPISNVFTEARMFRNGQLHVTSGAAPEVVDLMKRDTPSQLRQEPYYGTDLYRFNTTRKPLDDVRVRRALSMAMDRKSLCDSVYRGYTPAYCWTPPTHDYNPPALATFDPDAAKKLMAEAGFKDGKGFPRLKLLIASRETATTLATAVQAMWKEHLGIEVEIENKEWTAYLVATHDLDYDIVAGGWVGDFVDPLTFLEMWSPGNGNNNTGWNSPEFAATLAESFQASDPEKRRDLLIKAETILLADAPFAPVAWKGKNYLIHPSVQGWNPMLLDCHPYTSVRLVQPPNNKH